MHELSICRSIAKIVARHADGHRVATIHVQIGQLRQIIPDTLLFCWNLASMDSPLADSKLQIEIVRGRLLCNSCDTVEDLDTPALVCRSCLGQNVRVVAGEEFIITTIDLAETEAEALNDGTIPQT